MAKSFDELIKNGEQKNAARLFAKEYYMSGKMGHTRKLLIDYLADKLDEYEKPCKYCKTIDKATPSSPKKKYKFCPMCGKGIVK